MTQQSLLTLMAHPDDESFGMGGTLAKYAAEGVDLHIVIATDGAAGSVVPEFDDKKSDLVAIRQRELEGAIEVLDATLYQLSYRDSGMNGDSANDNPEAFIQSADYEAIGKMVKLIRQIRPTIVITHDETGGYFHPDHIRCWEIGTAAFHAAADPDQYPEFGLDAYQAQNLFYTAFSNVWLRRFTRILRLLRRDPTQFGRNKDIDLTKLGIPTEKIHVRINFRDYFEVKRDASAAHASQGGGGGPFRTIPEWAQRRWFTTESYIRAYPPAADGIRETDLFGDN